MSYNFDRIIERRGTGSLKWSLYSEDVLPLWVADMDFPVPEPIIKVLRAKVEHGIFGYEFQSNELSETVAARMEKLYGWQISPEAVVAIPGVISGFNLAARSICEPGAGILVQPPVYPPFLKVHENIGLVLQSASLAMTAEGSFLRYTIDFEAVERAVNSSGSKTGMFLLCSPHNPTGQVYPRQDLHRIAEICLKNNIFICSDEIHCELLLGGVRHSPIATLSPDIADRTINLFSPSKTFNVPGLYCAFAIITNPDLLMRFKKAFECMTLNLNNLGMAAAQVAFSGACDDWLAELRVYLTANRDFLVDYVQNEFKGIKTTIPDATYLAWLDCNDLVKSGKISGSPHKYFLHQAKVALNEGLEFGPGGEGFVRLNFGCPRATLIEALERMKAAIC